MFKLPAYFTGFSSKADGSAGLRFSTQELAPSDFATLKGAHGAFGWLLFASQELVADIDKRKRAALPPELLQQES